MPHFKSHTFTLPTLPFETTTKEGSFYFLQHYVSAYFKNHSLLHTRYTPYNLPPKDFFLAIKNSPKQNQYLIKCDKSSKIVPIEIAKTALLFLANQQNSLINHNLTPKNITPSFKLPFIKEIADIKELLDSSIFQTLWLEIGFGSGRHLLHNAKNNPDILHIGLEIHHPSLEQVARQIGLCKLTNILIINYDAKIFLELLPTHTLERIFVHFPVPWDKKPHRRVFSQSFLAQAHKVLKEQGTLELRTDSKEYFEYVQTLTKESPFFTSEVMINKQNEITSKYEARWRKQQKDIYDLVLTAKNTQKNTRKTYDFTFPPTDTIKQPIFKEFTPYKILKKDYFLSLEDLLIESNSTQKPQKILKISFGEFHSPQNRYIIIGDKIQYFKEEPLPTGANYQSHRLLCTLLFKG
ncbi:tRNA (guanosine(46)-N7)-methyltransferase TrmB [Helicobacter mesocricetorum]|uniref:tRNA (guanosine(46)-N7)-methyltransferase TrmB n=1 Tax=Helicobacter mesocricetorum TaxID=87012 RepID=UPI000CF1251F|nr:tRNA (guanosine(46)-N7)-methyltransferase TrmB [Helicobacter mesocricetorum]